MADLINILIDNIVFKLKKVDSPIGRFYLLIDEIIAIANNMKNQCSERRRYKEEVNPHIQLIRDIGLKIYNDKTIISDDILTYYLYIYLCDKYRYPYNSYTSRSWMDTCTDSISMSDSTAGIRTFINELLELKKLNDVLTNDMQRTIDPSIYHELFRNHVTTRYLNNESLESHIEELEQQIRHEKNINSTLRDRLFEEMKDSSGASYDYKQLKNNHENILPNTNK